MSWLVRHPFWSVEAPPISPGDILVDTPGLSNEVQSISMSGELKVQRPILGHVSLATGTPESSNAIWFSYFPEEFPHFVALRSELEHWVKENPKLDLLLPPPLDVAIPASQLIKVLKNTTVWYWKIEWKDGKTVHLTEEKKAETPLQHFSDEKQAYDGRVCRVPVVECANDQKQTCQRQYRMLFSDVTILHWKGSPEIPKMVLDLSKDAIDQKRASSCSRISRKELAARVGTCYPRIVNKETIPLLGEVSKHGGIQIQNILQTLSQSLLCGEFVVMFYQMALCVDAMLRTGRVDASTLDAMPMNAKFCTPTDISRLARQKPTYWEEISLNTRTSVAPAHKKRKRMS
jgi:hypothetical protein